LKKKILFWTRPNDKTAIVVESNEETTLTPYGLRPVPREPLVAIKQIDLTISSAPNKKKKRDTFAASHSQN